MGNEELKRVLMKAINQFDNVSWRDIVEAVNVIREDASEESPLEDPNLSRLVDDFAIKTAWIYERLGDKKRAKAIRKALGYNVK